MRKQSGITLVEVLIVIGIILVIFAIVTPVYKNGVQKGNELDTKMRLAQVYRAIVMYDTDYPDSPRLHPNLDIPLAPMMKTWHIVERLGSKEPMYCKIAPPCAREKMASTHQFALLRPSEQLTAERANRIMTERIEKLGAKFPLVASHCEDEVYYQPHEKDLGSHYQKPFLIFVTPSGSVHGERTEGARWQFLARSCQSPREGKAP